MLYKSYCRISPSEDMNEIFNNLLVSKRNEFSLEDYEKQFYKHFFPTISLYLAVIGSGSQNENGSFVHILLDINLTFLRRKHKF